MPICSNDNFNSTFYQILSQFVPKFLKNVDSIWTNGLFLSNWYDSDVCGSDVIIILIKFTLYRHNTVHAMHILFLYSHLCVIKTNCIIGNLCSPHSVPKLLWFFLQKGWQVLWKIRNLKVTLDWKLLLLYFTSLFN